MSSGTHRRDQISPGAVGKPVVMKNNDEIAQAQTLAEAMRSIRKARRLRTSEVAHALDMPTRTYEHFESGRGRLTFDRIYRFARVTDSDPVALMASVLLGNPAFALRCADNKLMEVILHAMGELDEELTEDIALIETRTVVAAIRRTCHDLAEHVRKRDTFAEAWLQERVAKSERKPVSPSSPPRKVLQPK